MSECTRSEIRDRLPDYVNGTLPSRARAEVEAHLASCERCRAEVSLVTAARDMIVRRTPTVNAARISAAVRKAGAPAREGARARTLAHPRPAFAWRAAAAVLILGAAAYAGYAVRGKPAPVPAPIVAVAPAPPTTPIPAPRPKPSTNTSTNTNTNTSTPLASLTFGGVDDLTPAQAAAMMQELDHAAPTLDADPASEIALETAS